MNVSLSLGTTWLDKERFSVCSLGVLVLKALTVVSSNTDWTPHGLFLWFHEREGDMQSREVFDDEFLIYGIFEE